MRYGRFLLGVVLTLLLVGLVAGVAWTAYNAGIMQGIAQSGILTMPATEGTTAPTPNMVPFWFFRPFGFHPFGFGFLWCLGPLFFFLIIFLLFRLAFRPNWGRGWGGGPWMRGDWDPSQSDIPPRVKEWHRKLHEDENKAPVNPTA